LSFLKFVSLLYYSAFNVSINYFQIHHATINMFISSSGHAVNIA